MTKIIKLRGRDKSLDIKWNHKNTQLIQTKSRKRKINRKRGGKRQTTDINATI